jgi:hypothetical protein
MVIENLDVKVSSRADQTSVNTLITNVNNLQNSVTVFHHEFTANAIVVNTSWTRRTPSSTTWRSRFPTRVRSTFASTLRMI